MKTSSVIFFTFIMLSGACFGKLSDGEIRESLGQSFDYVVQARPAIVARMNMEMDELTQYFLPPEVAAGLHVVLEPGDAKHNTDGYWIHLHGKKSLWRAIGTEKISAFALMLARRYEDLAAATKSGLDATRKDVAALSAFLASERKTK